MNNKVRVVVADDNKEFCRTMRDYFAGCDDIELIGAAFDGKEAYEMVLQTKPDVLLTDVVMPNLDGLGVLSKLNNTSELTKKPNVIVISAIGNDKIIRSAMNLGAKYYIIKPADLSVIADRVREFKETMSMFKSVKMPRKTAGRFVRPRNGRHRDYPENRRACAYKRLSVYARRDNYGYKRYGRYKLGYKNSLSHRGEKV